MAITTKIGDLEVGATYTMFATYNATAGLKPSYSWVKVKYNVNQEGETLSVIDDAFIGIPKLLVNFTSGWDAGVQLSNYWFDLYRFNSNGSFTFLKQIYNESKYFALPFNTDLRHCSRNLFIPMDNFTFQPRPE